MDFDLITLELVLGLSLFTMFYALVLLIVYSEETNND